VLFETSVTFGSKADAAKLIVTMNTDLTLVTSKQCLSCADKIYDMDNSSTKMPGTYDLKEVQSPDTDLTQSLNFTGATY
jgi:hypothetical protein